MARRARILVILTMFAAAAPAARADFAAGVKAFRSADYETAFAEWMPLAERGSGDAQYNLGILYQYGLGIENDFAVAALWYRRAAEQYHPNAQAKLGYLLARGLGIAKDLAKSARWFREAAEQGVADARFNLGLMYAMGSGVERDRVQALMWLNLAHEGGVAEADARRADLAREMTPEEIEEAALLAEYLVPDPAAQTAQRQASTAKGSAGAPKSPPSTVTSVSATLAAARATTTTTTATSEAPIAVALPEPAAAPTPVAPPEPAAPMSPGAPETGEIVVHLASYLSRQAAADGWSRLSSVHADLLGALGHDITVVTLDDQGTFYRLRAGPVENVNTAQALCSQLNDRNVYCATAF